MNFDYEKIIKLALKIIKPALNVGAKEQKIRFMIGSALVFISVFTACILFLLLGLILIGTAYLGRCPVYASFNYNTLEQDDSNSSKPVTTNKNPASAVTKSKPETKAKLATPSAKESIAPKKNTASKNKTNPKKTPKA